jgi:hypothetical protein
MMARKVVLIVLGCLYWAIALILTGLTIGVPCGFAPGAWCEEEGSHWLGAVLRVLGPIGVLLVAAAIYAATAIWMSIRQRKVH